MSIKKITSKQKKKKKKYWTSCPVNQKKRKKKVGLGVGQRLLSKSKVKRKNEKRQAT